MSMLTPRQPQKTQLNPVATASAILQLPAAVAGCLTYLVHSRAGLVLALPSRYDPCRRCSASSIMDADFAGTLGCCICDTVTPSAILLDCLHSCCQDCAGTGEGKSITCRICKDVSSLTGKDTNRFVAAQLQARSSCLGVTGCNVCPKKGLDQQAGHWCRECGQHLCDDCMQEHKIHVPSHTKHIFALVDALSELAKSAAATRPCSAHGENCSFYCKKCIAVKCTTCMKACWGSKHDFEHVDSKEASQSVQLLKQQLRDVIDLLESKSSLVTSTIKLPDDLQRARQADMDALERNKTVAVAALHRAYKAAADELESMHDAIAAGAIEAAEAAQLLDTKFEQATKYGKCMLEFGDTVSLLEQQRQVLSRLQSLVDEVSALPAALQPWTYITIHSSLPEKLDETCKNWIGVPKLQTAEVQPSGPSQLDDADVFNQNQGKDSISFTTTVQCEDVAVTAEDHLLLAARAHGMLEYDESGRQLNSWTPAKTATGGKDEVWTVDELQDGRVAVGVYYAQTVQLLRRSSAARDSWQQQQVFQLQGAPVHLSVHAQLVAVAEWAGQLVLLSLTDGRELLRHDPGYRINLICSVAATADAVITASWGQVPLSDGRQQYVVDSYSHSGQLLWRQPFSEQVYDMHWSQVLSVVYLALSDSDRVSAIRAVDGKLVSEVLNSSHGLEKPWRLSLSRGPRTALAVLHYDEKTVTVCPALGSGGSK